MHTHARSHTNRHTHMHVTALHFTLFVLFDFELRSMFGPMFVYLKSFNIQQTHRYNNNNEIECCCFCLFISLLCKPTTESKHISFSRFSISNMRSSEQYNITVRMQYKLTTEWNWKSFRIASTSPHFHLIRIDRTMACALTEWMKEKSTLKWKLMTLIMMTIDGSCKHRLKGVLIFDAIWVAKLTMTTKR